LTIATVHFIPAPLLWSISFQHRCNCLLQSSTVAMVYFIEVPLLWFTASEHTIATVLE
jgi:hypothetical protein